MADADKLTEQIVNYYKLGDRRVALGVGLIFLQLAENNLSAENSLSAYHEFLWWLKAAGFSLDEFIARIHCPLERERVRRALCEAQKGDI